MLPPPVGTPPRPGSASSKPLVPCFADVLSATIPTVRHIPAMCRQSVAAELARLVNEVAVPVPTWEAVHRLTCFPKLVLSSSGRGGAKHQRKAAHDMEQRLKLFQTGQLSQLWAEARARTQGRPVVAPRRTRGRARIEEDGTMPESQVESIRALVEEGALAKAAKMLLSTGLADAQDPTVEGKLRALHPAGAKHLVAGADLPSLVQGSLGDATDADQEWVLVWAKRAWDAISSFPPG